MVLNDQPCKLFQFFLTFVQNVNFPLHKIKIHWLFFEEFFCLTLYWPVGSLLSLAFGAKWPGWPLMEGHVIWKQGEAWLCTSTESNLNRKTYCKVLYRRKSVCLWDRVHTSSLFSKDSSLSFLLANAALVYRCCVGRNKTYNRQKCSCYDSVKVGTHEGNSHIVWTGHFCFKI